MVKPIKCKSCHREIKRYEAYDIDEYGLRHLDCPVRKGKKVVYKQKKWNWNTERRNYNGTKY